MRLITRLLMILLTLVVILVLAAGGGALYAVRKDFPQIDGTLKVSGLQAQVDVIRDRYGVPHIYAQNEHDLWFTQGYVQAQDRFWQMEFWRRIGQGRLSEILGGATARTDRYLRTLGLHRVVQAELKTLTPDERTALQAYADGVNTYLADHKGNLGLEFTLLGLNGVKFDPEPWTPANSLTWVKLMALNLGANMDYELLRTQLIAAVGPEKAAELFPAVYPDNRPVIMPPAGRFDGLNLAALRQDVKEYRALVGMPGDGLGSNNWVVAGRHTTTGMPFLANDPHLGIAMPSIWHEVDLHCTQVTPTCRYQVAGFSFAGVPGVVLGHNARIAWGMTNLGPDVQDLYVEDLQGDAVRFQGELVPLQTVEEVITVAGRLPENYQARPNEQDRYDEPSSKTTITLQVRSVPHHGPLVSDTHPVAMSIGRALSLKWTALAPAHMINMLLLLNRAQNWDEFRTALSYWQAPSQNMVYADVDGHIGWQVPGDIPIRPEGCDGLTPAPGDGSCEWQGLVPYDELPRSFDPPQGWIATANNAPVGPDYPYVLGREWDLSTRAARIMELLGARDQHSLDDMAAIQFDSKDVYASEIVPALLQLKPADARAQQALGLLQSWDFQARRDRVGEALFSSWYVHLLRDTYGDELGTDLSADYLDHRARNQVVFARTLADPASPWWDDVSTPEQKETRAQILERSLNEALHELAGQLGDDMSSWTWGRLHTATFENESLGQSNALGGLLKRLLNRGPVAVDGGFGIVNATNWSVADPYAVTSLPSLRALYDLSDFNRSRTVHTTGQSGHPYNAHYDDFTTLWANGQYHEQWWDRTAVEQNAEGHLVLGP